MWLTLISLVIALRATESENTCDSNCKKFHLSYLEDFDPAEDVSTQCLNNECLILETHNIAQYPYNGFCVRDKVLYAYWECGLNENLIDRKIKFACLQDSNCKEKPTICDPENLADRCLCDKGVTGTYCTNPNSTTTTTETSTFSVRPTGDSEATEPTTTETTTFSAEITTPETTEPPFQCNKGSCLEGECFFENHCYFFYDPEFFQTRYTNFSKERIDLYDTLASDFCSGIDPTALALAVESSEENFFVKNLILNRKSAQVNGRRILTSGIKKQKPPGEWQGWGSELNETLLGLETSHAAFPEYIALRENSGTVIWYYQSAVIRETSNEISILCERGKDWITSPDFIEECKALEVQKICSEGTKFCCAADENGTLWLGCSGTWSRKNCFTVTAGSEKHSHSRWWYCNENGIFDTELPYSGSCDCDKCVSRYEGINFKTCHGLEAIGNCRKDSWGYSKWFCGSDGLFEDVPDFDACCSAGEEPCRGVDSFMTVWVACPGKTARKRTRCPEGTVFETAEATWHCGKNGPNFASESPDYSGCDCPDTVCLGTDEYHDQWKACAGETSVKDCPFGYGGKATWRCGSDGLFENPRPDYSECLPNWVDDVQKEVSL